MLRHCIPATIRQTLNQLPKSLDDSYLRVLSQIPQANQTHAHRMLQCLVVAVRPLRVEELAELLAFEFDAAQGGIPRYHPALRLDNQTQAVLSTCSSLVTIIDDKHRMYGSRQIVQFSHFSVKEFLVSNRLSLSLGDISRYRICLGSAHIALTQACLGLLLHSDNHITESAAHSHLAPYAARHWVEHAQFEDTAFHVNDAMETLFDPDKPHFEAWVGIYNIDPEIKMWDRSEHPSLHPSPLYYSMLCGFYDLVEQLAINHPQYVNAFGGKYGFPLLAALGQGHVEVAELLLKHGADVDVRESTGKTILLMALSWLEYASDDNLHNIVEFLLTHGADVNARDDTSTSSLHLASGYGMQQVVTILLKHQADVNSQDNHGNTPLHMLLGGNIYYEDSNHVKLLLEHGAKVNKRNKDNQTPFLLAMKLGWFRIARILLEHGADAMVENVDGKSPWHLLSENQIYNEDEVLDHALLLWRFGVEVNISDENNETPLHLAIRTDLLKLAGFLLEHGADANAENDQGMTPLHMLSEAVIKDEGDVLNLVRLLLKHGAEVNRRDKNNQTPLHVAMQTNQLRFAGFLLEHGADANAENQGMTPLHMLLDSWIYEEDVLDHGKLLLKHGVEVNRRDKDNQTPLHLAIRTNQFRLAWILLAHGADASAKNSHGITPLDMLMQLESWFNDEDDNPNLLLLLQLFPFRWAGHQTEECWVPIFDSEVVAPSPLAGNL